MPTETPRGAGARRHPARRRRCVTAIAAAAVLWCAAPARAGEDAAGSADLVDLWLDLDAPLSRPRRVRQQQEAVGQRLRELGITELARVRQVRNAIAVRARRDQVPMLHRIPGVVRVRPATTRHPPRPDAGSPQS